MSAASPAFAAAVAADLPWADAVASCLDQLGDAVSSATLGFVYLTDGYAGDAGAIVDALRSRTGLADWVGAAGLGICHDDRALFDRPALSVLVAPFPADQVRVLPPLRSAGDLAPLRRRLAPWLDQASVRFGIIHADPRNVALTSAVGRLADLAGGYLVGGLSSGRERLVQIGGGVATQGSLTGVLFGEQVAVATGLSQGCVPIGPPHLVTEGDDSVVKQLDGRPAFEVLRADLTAAVGGGAGLRVIDLASNPVFVALPVVGSDTGDYRVRNLVGIDPEDGWLAIGDEISRGQTVIFTRRDQAAARADLERMLTGLARRLPGPPRAALYVSCVARGPNLFDRESEELEMIQRLAGPVPLTGFFANGEICRDQVYGYTGVLTLFL